MEKYICIHGHFYQPPRENPWLETIETQYSAYPYHDWNERISAECYMTNSCSRILSQNGTVIKKIVNNYDKISFNFGPTLLSWMKESDPEVYQSILQADKKSMFRYGGHGSAIAQVYNHVIMPLANYHDKETQIKWGISDFQSRFQRKPEGMWLAETAVDTETLELLSKNDILYTILAPNQAQAIRKIDTTKSDQSPWEEVNQQSLNTHRAYLCKLPSGRTINLFFYNGKISQKVAFDGLLNNGENFAEELLNSFQDSSEEAQLVHIATDGETYGHHHKKGEMALSFCLDYIKKSKRAVLTNYGQFLEKHPPQYEVKIHENSSWSCAHGVERWKNNCGCNTGMNKGWHQNWRKPLREALDGLRDMANQIFEHEGGAVLRNKWDARNDYIQVILSRSSDSVEKFMKLHSYSGVSYSYVLRLLEMQRHVLLMYTSCGWFFDEISGIETVQILQYSCRIIQLTAQMGGREYEKEFLQDLAKAPSNKPELRDGATLYLKHVIPNFINLKRVGMHYAVASIFEESTESLTVFNYTTSNEFFVRRELGELRLVLGITRVRSQVTYSEKKFSFAVLYMGKHNIIGNISLDISFDMFTNMQYRMVKAFDEGRISDVISVMQTFFGPEKFNLWELFSDEKIKIMNRITQQRLAELERSFQRAYDQDYPLITLLARENILIPTAYRTAFQYVLNTDLKNSFLDGRIKIKTIERVADMLKQWDLKLQDQTKIEQLIGNSIYEQLQKAYSEQRQVKRLIRLNKLFPILHNLKLHPNLHKSQNLFFQISCDIHNRVGTDFDPGWIEQFNQLGEFLDVKVEFN